MNRQLTYLCPVHSSRQTQRVECADCQQQKRLAIYDRRIRELETQVERLEARLTALETTETADALRVEA